MVTESRYVSPWGDIVGGCDRATDGRYTMKRHHSLKIIWS